MDKTESKPKWKKVVGVLLNVLLYVFFALCLTCVVFALVSPKKNGAVSMFGKQVRLVLSGSMESDGTTDVSQYEIKSIKTGSLVFIQEVPEDQQKANEWYANLKVGDVLTFNYVYSTQVTITHRLVKIEAGSNGGYKLTLEGDNKNASRYEGDKAAQSGGTILPQVIDTGDNNPDHDQQAYKYVIGKVTGVSVFLGAIVGFLTKPVGIILVIILPCVIIVVLEIIRIAGVVREGKEAKQQSEIDKQQSEIEELKRQLALMQSQAKGNADEADDPPKDNQGINVDNGDSNKK